MSEIFVAAALLACPVGMGLMMWFMMRGKSSESSTPAEHQPQHPDADAELAQLRAEVDQLHAALRDAGSTAGAQPTSAVDGADRR